MPIDNFFTRKMLERSQRGIGSTSAPPPTSFEFPPSQLQDPLHHISNIPTTVLNTAERNSQSQDPLEESDRSRPVREFSSSSSSTSASSLSTSGVPARKSLSSHKPDYKIIAASAATTETFEEVADVSNDKKVTFQLNGTRSDSKSDRRVSSSSSGKKRNRDTSGETSDKGKSKRRRTSQKMCTRVSSDLSDEERFMELLKIIGEHTKKAYCNERDYLSNLHDKIFARLHQFAKAKVPGHYTKNVRPNEKNMALKAKEHVLQCLIARLEAEENDWNKIKLELEQNVDNERYLEIDPEEIIASIDKQKDANMKGDEEESYNEQKYSSALSDVVPFHKKMHDLMIKTSIDIDSMNMSTGEIAQLQQIAASHIRYLELRQREESEEPDENLPLLYEFGDPKKLIRDMQNDDEDSNDVRDE